MKKIVLGSIIGLSIALASCEKDEVNEECGVCTTTVTIDETKVVEKTSKESLCGSNYTSKKNSKPFTFDGRTTNVSCN